MSRKPSPNRSGILLVWTLYVVGMFVAGVTEVLPPWLIMVTMPLMWLWTVLSLASAKRKEASATKAGMVAEGDPGT
jgi:hypothetical protein